MTNAAWGTKRNCLSCSAHFYDLNKVPAVCPKCKHTFDPAVAVKAKRKTVRRDSSDLKKDELATALPEVKKAPVRKKAAVKDPDAEAGAGGLGDIAEMEEVDDIESLRELSELEEREESPVVEDDADDEAIIEELQTGDKSLVGNVEDEEASALVAEIEDEQSETVSKAAKAKPKKKT